MTDRVVTTGTHEQAAAFPDGRPGISVSYWLTLPGRHDFAREVALFKAAPALLAALEDIAKGEGAFDRDPLRHAENVIEEAKATARAALALARGK